MIPRNVVIFLKSHCGNKVMKPHWLFTLTHFHKKVGEIYVDSHIDVREDTLTIIFSSIPQKPMLKKLSGSLVRLYENVIDKRYLQKESYIESGSTGGWFLGDVSQTLRTISQLIVKSESSKIVFLGSSKSAYAAMLYAHYVSIQYPKKRIGVYAFSPATDLLNLRRFKLDNQPTLAKLQGGGHLEREFTNYGDLAELLKDSLIRSAHVVYSDGFKDDVDDFKRIKQLHFVTGHKLSQTAFEKVHLHPHLTLEYLWKYDQKQFCVIYKKLFNELD